MIKVSIGCLKSGSYDVYCNAPQKVTFEENSLQSPGNGAYPLGEGQGSADPPVGVVAVVEVVVPVDHVHPN